MTQRDLRIREALARPVRRGRLSLADRRERLRARGWQVAQCAVAAGLAWWVAHDLFGHPQPFFAPVAAVVSLGTTYGQRLRRVGEMAVGVALGVLLGDLYTQLLGRGVWQITVMVAASMVVALLLDASALLVNQAAIQSLVVVTVLPNPGLAFVRWTDALVGGGVALLAATVVPQAPLRRPREQAAVVMRKVAELLTHSASAVRTGDVEEALDVLSDARGTDGLVEELRTAASEGLSVVSSSPFRRVHHPELRTMSELVEPLDLALRNTRVLVRRVSVATYRDEVIPLSYADFLDDLAEGARKVAAELAAGRMPREARPLLLDLGAASTRLERTPWLSAEVVLAQARSILADLLSISGMDRLAATDAIPPLGPEDATRDQDPEGEQER